ncbi:hypothetical protein M9H77_27317 [Catharanthus roseus]|uniref:Uncharacterized protein n=1 Tax=Catharanthus roseus TaxID=4058 RepID=A0ACC0ACJ9_CATRO|nr:hypothetical protein M9H77_27317 [Catharanthus roseus]
MWQAGTEYEQWKFDRVMKEIQERNVDAYIYLMKLDPKKWTLLHDGRPRHGIMTTNISEALDSVLKKSRIEMKSREHKVTTYNPREGIYMIKFPIQVSGTGNNVYTLQINNKSCSCGKWKTYTLPCSHVLVIYSRQTYKRTCQENFHPVLSENFWRDVPFNLTFYPPNMKNERGRKQGKRF